MAEQISHKEAREILQRFVHAAFGRGGEMPRLSIPADPLRDDDLRLSDYITQQEDEQKARQNCTPSEEAPAEARIAVKTPPCQHLHSDPDIRVGPDGRRCRECGHLFELKAVPTC